MVELAVLRLFTRDRTIYNKYKDIYKETTQEKEIKNLYNLITLYYSKYEEHEHISQDEFMILYQSEYPNHKHKLVYEDLIHQIFSMDVSRLAVQDILNQLVAKEYAAKIANAVMPVLSGDEKVPDFSKVSKLVEEFTNYEPAEEDKNPFFETQLDDLLVQTQGDGLKWMLKSMQHALGSPCGGSLGHVFARPEAGKTSFCHSVAGYFAPQLHNGDIVLWFNNEEAPARLLLRLMEAVTGMSESEIRANPQRAKDLFRERGGHRIKIVDEAVLSVDYIERMCKEYRPRFVIIDQGDKVAVSGAGNMSTPEKLKAIYDQLREVVKRCNKDWIMDMLTVGQASVEAEDRRILTQAMLDSGKTGKAGAFDYIIGIGYEHGKEDMRYITFPKNKLQGDHGTYVVAFDKLRGRYSD